jgi:hypothetical protein
MTTLCRTCRSNPVACEGLCVVCLRDKLAADKERRRIDEQRQRQQRRRIRPAADHPWQRPLWERREP